MGQTPSAEDSSDASASSLSNHGIEESETRSNGEETSRINEEQEPVSLESLTDRELRSRLEGIQREDLLAASASHTVQVASSSSFSSIDMANRLLDLSPQLTELRFKLVPSRIKEEIFWQAVFTILHGGPSCDDSDDVLKKEIPKRSLCRTESGNPTVAEELRQTLLKRNQEIARLHQQLAEFEAVSIDKVEKKKTTPQHKGRWVMDKDSLEFLALPEDLKINLRREKQKRLEEIRSNMKFILDTDNMHDSHGTWDCCGKTTYDAQGCDTANISK